MYGVAGGGAGLARTAVSSERFVRLSLKGSNVALFPPAHSVVVDLLDRLRNAVLLAVFVHGAPACRQEPVVVADQVATLG